MAFLKNDKLMMIGVGRGSEQPNTTISQMTSAENNHWSYKFSWVCFLTQETQK